MSVQLAVAPTSVTTSAAPSPAQSEPAERRMFQFTDLVSNHNKFYLVEQWPVDAHHARVKFSWGRVGSKPQVQEKVVTYAEIDRQIAEKVRKGYRPVDLHRPEVVIVDEQGEVQPKPQIDPKVRELVEWIFREAGEHINSFLAVEVEALSQAQIATGRDLLATAQTQYTDWQANPTTHTMLALAETVQAYYNAIPTKLPHRLNRDEVVQDFCKDLNEQENRLLQLEAAIATMKVQRQHPGRDYYQQLGADIKLLSPDDPQHAALLTSIKQTQVHGYNIKVRDIFEVCIPGEREAYEKNKKGRNNKMLLFHGTRNQNVRHIVRQGLICPKTPSHGRMLGNGIYLANKASKSTNYCGSSRRGVPQMLLVVEAAIGRPFVTPIIHMYNKPPFGHDSVLGKAGHTHIGPFITLANDEYVVYSPEQQTLRYLVTFER